MPSENISKEGQNTEEHEKTIGGFGEVLDYFKKRESKNKEILEETLENDEGSDTTKKIALELLSKMKPIIENLENGDTAEAEKFTIDEIKESLEHYLSGPFVNNAEVRQTLIEQIKNNLEVLSGLEKGKEEI